MLWANTSHNPMPHMVIHIIPIGGTTLISLGSLTPPAYVPTGAKQQFGSSPQPQPSPSSSPVEQVILNLSKVVGNFVEEKKGINEQLAQRIGTVESTVNKRIDGLESSLNKKLIIYSIPSPGLPICWSYRRKEDSLPKHCQIQRESMK